MQLNKEDLTSLIKGASILTTGGGLCLQDQLESLNKRDTISLNLLDLNEFKDDDLLITASEVGTTNGTPKPMAVSMIIDSCPSSGA